MIFQSYLFLLYLPLVLAGWVLLAKSRRAQRLWLLAAGLVFYGYSSLTALLLLLAEGLLTWLTGRAMLRRPAWKKALAALGALFLLAVLVRFKYAGFFLETLTGGTRSVAALALPLGLSFVTFQQLFYLRDCYHGDLTPLSLPDFALWLTFFPTVSSGPITRAGEIAEQFHGPAWGRFNWDAFAAGLYAFSLGLAKKVLLSETLARAANFGFAGARALSPTDAALAILSYTFQLYFDFSGYCDMAWGLAKMLGVELPRNFDAPYRAASVTEFWDRWHITLTRFFRTCVYFPLGGSRRGLPRTCLNIMIVFLLSGLWHGAGWTFLLWGALHGGAMVVERLLKGKVNLPRWLGWVLTFAFVNLAWVWFRAPDLSTAAALLGDLAGLPGLPSQELCAALLPELSKLPHLFSGPLSTAFSLLVRLAPAALVALSLGLCLLVRDPIRQAEDLRLSRSRLVLCAAALVCSVCSFSGVAAFLYVNF